ncbi:MAG: fluoride efflux transporter CrcB, partial [Gemmatimonadetes bacterium]|nr:fluoride efflux transporter CrcB [Gemmatimonadota bacterium]
MTYLWIALGSAIGGVGRYWCNSLVTARLGPEFPWGTMLVNVAGSLLIGVVAALSASIDRPWPSSEARAFIMVGFCGGYTTFSAFSLQTLELLHNGEWIRAGGNIL